MALAIAEAKADAILDAVKDKYGSVLLVTCDEVIVCDGQVREKPKDIEQAKEFLMSYNEHPAEAVCGVVVHNTGTGIRLKDVGVARQYFKNITQEVCDRYVSCAGSCQTFLMEGYLC